MKVVVLPDSQNGFRGKRTLHDRRAWEDALEIAADADAIVLLGDMVDLAPLSLKYRTAPELVGTTRRTIDETRAYLERLPPVPRYYIAGNHEERWMAALLESPNKELATLPGLTLPHLLGLDEMGIAYVGPYGASLLLDGVEYTHGSMHSTWGGATAAKYLQRYDRSIVFGHSHKSEIAYRRWPSGKVTFAMCPGTLARCDGTVPGAPRPDWTQGVGIVYGPGHATIVPVGGNSRGRRSV